MKTIGLLGGMSWKSTLEYYRIINEEAQKILGKYYSAKCLLYSFNYNDIISLQSKNEMKKITEMMVDAAKNLKKAGADFIVICTNTKHMMADDIQRGADIEVLHIADATADDIKACNINKVALLGSRFTMEETFYRDILQNDYNIDVLIPDEYDREKINNIIYNELIIGNFLDKSRQEFVSIIKKMQNKGAEGVILGCTEIPLLIGQKDVDIKVFDTTAIHAKAALNKAIEGYHN